MLYKFILGIYSLILKGIMKMKKKFLRAGAAVAVISLMLMTAACGGTESESTNTQETSRGTEEDDILNPVDIGEIEVEDVKTLENPNLLYFGFYDIRTAADIKPGVKLFEETYGGKIDYIEVAWGDRITKLSALIQSGDSPDIVVPEDNTFPHYITKNLYQDMTDYIDISTPLWAGMADLIKSFEWNGKRYYVPFTAEASPNWLVYNETLFNELGLDLPRDLYAGGEWDWNTFKSIMMQFMDRAPDAICGYYGLSGYDFILSTGTPLIGMEDGKLVNNIKSQSVERAANFLDELRKQGLTYFGDGMWSNEPEPLANGASAFLGVGVWRFTGYCKDYPDMDFNLVPYPRDPNADEYYMGVSTFGYLVPNGSKNIEGAAEFINMVRRTKTDPELMQITKDSMMVGKNYTEEQYDWLDSFCDDNIVNFNVVTEVGKGMNEEINQIISDMMNNITFSNNENAQSWTQLRTSYEVLIDEAVEGYNALR